MQSQQVSQTTSAASQWNQTRNPLSTCLQCACLLVLQVWTRFASLLMSTFPVCKLMFAKKVPNVCEHVRQRGLAVHWISVAMRYCKGFSRWVSTDLFVTPSGTTFRWRGYSRWMIWRKYILYVVGGNRGRVLNLEDYFLSAGIQSEGVKFSHWGGGWGYFCYFINDKCFGIK